MQWIWRIWKFWLSILVLSVVISYVVTIPVGIGTDLGVVTTTVVSVGFGFGIVGGYVAWQVYQRESDRTVGQKLRQLPDE